MASVVKVISVLVPSSRGPGKLNEQYWTLAGELICEGPYISKEEKKEFYKPCRHRLSYDCKVLDDKD